MTYLLVHTELLHKGAADDPLTHWLLPSALVVGGVLAAGLIGVTFGTPQSGSMGKAVAPGLASVGTINTRLISSSAMQPVLVAAPAPAAAEASARN